MNDKNITYSQKHQTETSFRTFCQLTDTTKPTETVVPIDIIEHQGEKYTLQNAEGLQVQIDEALITDNSLSIDVLSEKLLVPESLVRAWFGPIRKKRQQQEEQRLWELFAVSVPLFWHHRKRILTDPELFGARTPMRINMAYIAMKNSGPYPLGVVVRAWTEHGENYTRTCPKCGGQMLIHSFAGSPLSGCSSYSATCTECGHRKLHATDSILSHLATPIMNIDSQYSELMQNDALSLNEAIERLK